MRVAACFAISWSICAIEQTVGCVPSTRTTKVMCVEGGSDALLICLSCLSVFADQKRPFTSRIRYLPAARIFTPDRIESVRKRVTTISSLLIARAISSESSREGSALAVLAMSMKTPQPTLACDITASPTRTIPHDRATLPGSFETGLKRNAAPHPASRKKGGAKTIILRDSAEERTAGSRPQTARARRT